MDNILLAFGESVSATFHSCRIQIGVKSKDVNLTKREREILVSFCRGMSYVAIAAAREVKVVTVRNAIYTIQMKLGVDSKQEIVVWAAQNGGAG